MRKRSASPHSAAGATSRTPAPLDWSEECCRLLGARLSLGSPPVAQLIELIHPDDRVRVRGLAQRASTRRQRRYRIPHRARQRPGALAACAARDVHRQERRGDPAARHPARHHAAEAGRGASATSAIAGLNTALFGSSLILVDVDPARCTCRSAGTSSWAERRGGPTRLRGADGAHPRGRAGGDTARIRRGGHGPQARLQPRAPRARRDGSLELDQEPRASVERDATAAPRLAGINEDITARKEAEARLRQSESRFRACWRFLRLVLGAGRRSCVHRGRRDGSASRPAGHRAVPGQMARNRGDSACRVGPCALSLPHSPRASPSAISRSPSATPTANGASSPFRASRCSMTAALYRLPRHRARRHPVEARRGAHTAPRPLRRAHRAAQPHHVHAQLQHAFSLAQRAASSSRSSSSTSTASSASTTASATTSGDTCLPGRHAPAAAALRESDTVARFGGDEFVVLVETAAIRDESPRSAQGLL